MISNIFSWPAFWGDHLSFPLEGNASQPTSSHICKFQSVWLLIQFWLLGSVIITASVQKGNGKVQSDKESTGVGSCYNQQGPAMIKGDWGISWLRNEDSWSLLTVQIKRPCLPWPYHKRRLTSHPCEKENWWMTQATFKDTVKTTRPGFFDDRVYALLWVSFSLNSV